MAVQKIVITAALPYANGSIHVGHLLEYVQADIYSRFLKLTGKDCLYLCASDMHGTPIEINAQKAGVPPEEFVEKYWKEHQEDFASFLISFDNYWKTHSPENRELSEWFFRTLKKNGHIYTKEIEQFYDEKAHRFLPDRFIKGNCPKCREADQYGDVCEKCGATYSPTQLGKPYSTLTNTKPLLRKSTHYFFRLSSFAVPLKKWINAKQSDIQPEMKNWLNGWLAKGLEDWCISRDAPYFGFEIPDSIRETGSQKYFYVWLDAPIGYLASLKKYCDERGKKWKPYLKGTLHHFIGKDIAYFHYLFWPAMFLGMGFSLPHITTHGFITVNGQKMSKSRGTFFTAKEFLKLYPAEALRFYYASHLNRNVVDIDLNFSAFVAANNNVLVGNLGNFCYRVLTFAEKNYGTITKVKEDRKHQQTIAKMIADVKKQYEQEDFRSALKTILRIADMGNAYFQQAEPWVNAPEKQAEVGYCVNLARTLAILSSPVLPSFCGKILVALGEKNVHWKDISFAWKGAVQKPALLVEKVEEYKQDIFPLHLVVGKVTEVRNHPNADSLFILTIDCGSFGKKQSVTSLKKHLPKTAFLQKKIVFCLNLKPAKFRGELSNALILAGENKDTIKLLEMPDNNPGDVVAPEGMSSSSVQITFEECAKIHLTVQQGVVVHQERKLKCGMNDVPVALPDGSTVS